MTTINWKGGAAAVAQVSDATVDTFDASTTYTVTIGGYAVSTIGVTDAATTASTLVGLLNASTNPYFAAVTWSVPSGSTVRGTADVAGAPFTASMSVSGGTGTRTEFSDTTSCTGPHHADNAENYDGGSLPGAGDDLVIADGPSILYALDGITGALSTIEVRQSYVGLVGLEPAFFATSLDGATTVGTVPEYRTSYFEVTADEISIGTDVGNAAATGSSRLAFDQQKAGASMLYIRNTGASAINGRPAVRYLAAHADADVIVESAPAGLGLAVEPTETATYGDIQIADRSSASIVRIGKGATYTNLRQFGGDVRVAAAATVTLIESHGGDLVITGLDYLITTLSVEGGNVSDVHENPSGGNEWTNINVYSGSLVAPGVTTGSRTFGTLSIYGGRVEADWSKLSGTIQHPTSAGVPDYRTVEVTG